jgi:hypothetical protein
MTYGHEITVTGDPNMFMKLSFLPAAVDKIEVGVPVAMPAINAIPAVCAARPGVVTCLDLPVISGRARVRP